MKVTAATAKEADARMRLAEAMARENLLKEEAANLAPERRLGRFIEQRAQSQDYRGQLGLISLARRDFQELSSIFADRDALNKRVAQLKSTEAKEELENLSRSIDRIVLFVDDLDRCQPEKVVDVLQAVHLLLAFPLFAVVVGVDQRCLKQSLRMQFKGLLTDEMVSSNGASKLPGADLDEAEDGRLATPLDYLEKIFHVPFHLPQMNETGFKKLIDRLTEPVAETTTSSSESQAEPKQREPKKIEPSELLANVINTPAHPETPKDVAEVNGKKTEPKADVAKVAPKSATPAAAAVGSVQLQRWEREALSAYHPLIHTPRGATRLLNTYRLVRASVPESEWRSFSGDTMSDGEFRVAMLLLAAAAGYPAQARKWFDRLRSIRPSDFFCSHEKFDGDFAWTQFASVYFETFEEMTTPVSHEDFTKWINRVERFAF